MRAISGTVSYWKTGLPVSDVSLTLSGSQAQTSSSDANGSYAFTDLAEGSYTLTPGKSDTDLVDESITALDCTLVMSHSVGATPLQGHALTAADVDRSGEVNALDGTYILRKSVDNQSLPFPGANAIWVFDPPEQSFSPLVGNQTRHFTAILLGDPSGNWNANTTGPGGAPASFSIPALTVAPGGQVQVPVNLSLAPESASTSFNLTIIYDPAVVSVVEVARGEEIASAWSLEANTRTAGEIKVGLSGTTPVNQDGELLRITFQATGAEGTQTDLQIISGNVDEILISQDSVEGGRLRIEGPPSQQMVYLPLIRR
ncbi:MAG: hypothetical protein HC884_09695 [Chloroflexaceae bacterium]|nr:hypothetical protein [Chloroflexaceae bacterium]